MKKPILLILAFALLLGCAACASPSAPAAEKESAPAAAAPETPVPREPESAEKALVFSTTALDGTAVDESILAGHTLTMINFFEPWCPPCVAELPELERLYETYAPEGFQILGVFSTEEGVEAVVQTAGLSYPVLRYVPVFDQFQTGYVPTTVFVNERGELVGETQIGSKDYAGWEALVKELLG